MLHGNFWYDPDLKSAPRSGKHRACPEPLVQRRSIGALALLWLLAGILILSVFRGGHERQSAAPAALGRGRPGTVLVGGPGRAHMHHTVLGKSKSERAGLLEFFAVDHDGSGAAQGRETRRDDNIRAGAILGESRRVEIKRHRPPGGEMADATELVAICFGQSLGGHASVGIGARPLLGRSS